jgi:hypothetical protein
MAISSRCPPKAKVGCSNHLGRASVFNVLVDNCNGRPNYRDHIGTRERDSLRGPSLFGTEGVTISPFGPASTLGFKARRSGREPWYDRKLADRGRVVAAWCSGCSRLGGIAFGHFRKDHERLICGAGPACWTQSVPAPPAPCLPSKASRLGPQWLPIYSPYETGSMINRNCVPRRSLPHQ